MSSGIDDNCQSVSQLTSVLESQEEHVCSSGTCSKRTEEGEEQRFLSPQQVKDGRWGKGLWCEFFPSSKAVLSGFSHFQTAARGWQRRERSSHPNWFWEAAKGWKIEGEWPATVSTLPAFQDVLPLLCMAVVFPKSSLEPQYALWWLMWCGVKSLKGMRPSQC